MTADITTNQRILLVDDQQVNIKILAEALQGDYALSFALSGPEALSMAKSETPPDMVLLDVMMPGMNGFEVCEKLKADETTARIPVIFVTAMNDGTNEEHGLQVGAADYLTKPICPPVVRARVRKQLELEQHREFLERLLARRTDDLKAAQDEARALLGYIDSSS